MADEISAAARRREAAPVSVASLFESFLDGRGDEMVRATRAWYAVNGDIERAHTTGTFVREPRRGETDPVLVVYVDSRARATDFAANSEVYLARLANAGMSYSKVEFRLSKYPRRPAEAGPGRTGAVAAAPGAQAARPLPPLSREEEDEIEVLLARVPEGMREDVRKAMRASYARSHE